MARWSLSAFSAELKAQFGDLSPQLQEAARWVIDHPADVALLSLREQARRSGVAPVTLTRLAQRFRLKGYDDIRRLYADAVRQRPESFHGRAQELLARHGSEGDAALARDVFAALDRHLAMLSAPESVRHVAAAAEMIASADHVFCLGQRSTYAVAFIFHYVRSLFGSKSVLVDGPGATGRDTLRTIGRGDVLLAVTLNPYVRETVATARFAKSRGAKVVAITDSTVSPLAVIADRVVVVGTETPSFFHTVTPAFAVVECLAALVAARRGKETLSALSESEKQLAAFDTYVTRRKGSRKRVPS
ncbi:transcriptional regulator, RpiR family [Enhydrobacter aerosaccus]|uniref:Transcriptional regulator, RpiR family n=1 Tax=Enhydrobacter aerosaccus TaxID=225324 RepID=A0A1T4NG88_9HYPH|nr:MurR/RpiR family transcriptional regulator [Enhydrobacter aerosaccus]SJZ78133.1 transcriptional regulator, RpiR family [Enhydrobacter aerosaccus]